MDDRRCVAARERMGALKQFLKNVDRGLVDREDLLGEIRATRVLIVDTKKALDGCRLHHNKYIKAARDLQLGRLNEEDDANFDTWRAANNKYCRELRFFSKLKEILSRLECALDAGGVAAPRRQLDDLDVAMALRRRRIFNRLPDALDVALALRNRTHEEAVAAISADVNN